MNQGILNKGWKLIKRKRIFFFFIECENMRFGMINFFLFVIKTNLNLLPHISNMDYLHTW